MDLSFSSALQKQNGKLLRITSILLLLWNDVRVILFQAGWEACCVWTGQRGDGDGFSDGVLWPAWWRNCEEDCHYRLRRTQVTGHLFESNRTKTPYACIFKSSIFYSTVVLSPFERVSLWIHEGVLCLLSKLKTAYAYYLLLHKKSCLWVKHHGHWGNVLC